MHRSYVRLTLVSSAVVLTFGACSRNAVAPEDTWAYRVTDGACGTLDFVEKVGADSASAVAAVEARIAGQYPEGTISFGLTRLRVVDPDGAEPAGRFYAVRVEDALSGLLQRSFFEVVSTDGDLFALSWCPD